jgi:hypothetical protein
LKEAIKRRRPDFNESLYGFRAFGNLLEEAQARGLLEFGRDEKSNTYVYRKSGEAVGAVALAEAPAAPTTLSDAGAESTAAVETGSRGKGRSRAKAKEPQAAATVEQTATPRRRARKPKTVAADVKSVD